ncbi:hypothetical protein [Bradyrhizobium glycinis]|uniref:hypothetical protein n=1 Tax=Bradyrhizobium glycinis TaxID=2751812 RepID=UPI0018D899A9|nr:hypothetical protein [Bradyrhizobium glycinis]MBH5372950.1 hypothetical protein [Bradyrhizobium glycinis]
MKRIDPAELDDIERELDELEAVLRSQRQSRRRAAPAVGGGAIATSSTYTECLRPRPAAFAKAGQRWAWV